MCSFKVSRKKYPAFCISAIISLLILFTGNAISVIHADEISSLENRPYTDTSSTQISPYTIEEGEYFIRNVYSGKYLDALNHSTLATTPVIQNEYSGHKSQRFKVEYGSDGYYTLKPLHDESLGLAIDLQSDEESNINGTLAQLYYYHSWCDEQKFIIRHDSRYIGYQIGTKCSNGNKVLGVVDSSWDDLALIEIWDVSFYDMNDNWIFEKVNFGSAPTYESMQSSFNSSNCAGFALRENVFIGAGVLDVQNGDTVETVATAIINYFNINYPSRTIRRINDNASPPTYEINDNEYRVALRVRNRSDRYWDYHFMLQLNDGSWANKHGDGPAEYLGFINPSTFEWTSRNGLYNSDTIYFAVSY